MYTHILTSPQVHAPKFVYFLSLHLPVNCKNTDKRMKLGPLLLLSHQKLILQLLGIFFPALSSLQDPNLMILSVALYILLFIRNNIQSSLDSICRAAESHAAERW